MKSSFSELSYAFALSDNLVKNLSLPLLSSPSFPSTAVEGKKGGGYDLKLSYPGAALFLQFKLSHCMTYGSAREFVSGRFPQVIKGRKEPVYRMYLLPLKKSRQTSLMLKLETRHKGLVYYVAPLFHLPVDLSRNYFAGAVAQESRFIRPSLIKKMPDQLEHFVSFRQTGSPWRFSVDPVEIERAETTGDLLEELLGPQRLTSANNAIDLALEAMLAAIHDDEAEYDRASDSHRPSSEELRALRGSNRSKAEFISRTYFDSQLFIFGTQPH
jgi:hypothetical protein